MAGNVPGERELKAYIYLFEPKTKTHNYLVCMLGASKGKARINKRHMASKQARRGWLHECCFALSQMKVEIVRWPSTAKSQRHGAYY